LTHSVKHGGKIAIVENKTESTVVENKTRLTPWWKIKSYYQAIVENKINLGV
jgi:hypothetical protein